MSTTNPQIDAAIAALESIGGDIDKHQIDNVEVKTFGNGYRIDAYIENVDREEGDVFLLDELDGGNHVTKAEDEDTTTQVWGHMLLDEEELSQDAFDAWEGFRPSGCEGQMNLVFHMAHHAGQYSDDETDASASVTIFVVGDADLDVAIETVKAMWREAIGDSAISKITDALEDVQLLGDAELMKIADLPAFCEINRRIASLIR